MIISGDGTKWSLPKGVVWMDSTNQVLIRDSWREIFSIMLISKNVILMGKAGRGKSVFILCAIFDILYCAKRGIPSLLSSTADRFPTDPKIVYVDRGGVRHFVTLDVFRILPNNGTLPMGVHYYFSDNVDVLHASLGSLLTLAATSGDKNVLKEYKKRMRCLPNGLVLFMPSLERREMAQLYPEIDSKELQFKFDVIGGNPRAMLLNLNGDDKSKYFAPVTEVVRFMFGNAYVTTNVTKQTKKQAWGRWAIMNVVSRLEDVNNPTTDSSFFKEYHITEKFGTYTEQYSSKFLCLVAGSLQEAFNEHYLDALKNMFGNSGMGNAFESTAHKKLMGDNITRWSRKSTGEYEELNLGSRSLFLIRDMEDVKSLQNDSYGLPTINNFPLVDAVLAPNMGLQMTTSNSHKGSVATLPKLLESLRVKESDFRMVFVVPINVLPYFEFPTDLGAVQMYVIIPEATSKKLFQQGFKKIAK